MNAAEPIAALDLPPGARVDRRVPRTLLVEHGAPTAADERCITEGIEEVLRALLEDQPHTPPAAAASRPGERGRAR